MRLPKNSPLPDDFVPFVDGFMQKLMIWGSDELVAEYARFRKVCLRRGDAGQIAESIARQILAIRKDLGHANKGIKMETILSVFLNDIATGEFQPRIANDELRQFMSLYGNPNSQDSTEYDEPRPEIPTKWLIYDKAKVKVFFYPDANVGDAPHTQDGSSCVLLTRIRASPWRPMNLRRGYRAAVNSRFIPSSVDISTSTASAAPSLGTIAPVADRHAFSEAVRKL